MLHEPGRDAGQILVVPRAPHLLMFSSRVPDNLTPNHLARALSRVRGAGVDIIDLTESNPTTVGFPASASLLMGLSQPEAGVYRPAAFGLPEARASVAALLGRLELAVDPAHIVLTTSTSEAYSFLFKLLCDPGDAVLVPRPSYPLFDHLTRLEGIESVPYALHYHGRWEVDLASVEKGLAARPGATRAVLVVNPNNPTGSFVTKSELDTIGQLCREHEAAVIADEVFGLYPMTGGLRGPSVLDLPAETLTFSLGGLSKAVGLPQLKLGWIVADGPPPLVERALARLELICDTYLSVATPIQVAAAALLENGEARTAQIARRVRENYHTLRRLAAAYPATQLLPVEGGWYAVVQIPATTPEEAIILDLLEHQQVLVHPGYFFDFPREAFLIVSLLPPPALFAEGVTRVLGRTSAPGDHAARSAGP